MSPVTAQIDLTAFGCPMHYIKAKEALMSISSGEQLTLLVNTGEAVEEVKGSLLQDGHQCDVESVDGLTTTLKVRKK
jgi:TusA-related sulfurtransferase